MADPKLRIIIDAEDNATEKIEKFEGGMSKAKATVTAVAAAVTAFAAVAAVAFKKAIDASNDMSNALTGLNSVAKAFKQDTDKAKKAAVDLAADGLMSVKDAAAGLKNLLATGFALPEAINLMNAFKDSAAFNRQGTLEFGQAIEGATQGIKNQNSIMVDNAGITKNLSLILKDAGFSIQDLSNVTSDAKVRQALYNGILKEASIFSGDAAKMAETLTGKQAALSTQVFVLSAAVGDLLVPIMTKIVELSSESIKGFQWWIATVTQAGGIAEYFSGKLNDLLSFIEAKTGLITIFQTAFENVALMVNVRLMPALQKLWVQLQPLAPYLAKLAEFFGILLIGAIIAFVKLLEVSLIVTIEALTWAIEKATTFIKYFREGWEGVIEIIAKVITYVDSLIEKIKSLNVISRASSAISGALGFGGARAEGGSVASGKSYLVGEQGAELFTPSTSGKIIPNDKLGGGGANVTVIVNGDVSGEELVQKVGDKLTRLLQLSTATV